MDLKAYIEERSIPEPNSGCWLWELSTNPFGYGYGWNGVRRTYAHRIAYEAFVGPVPTGHCVCHRCDNPSCCNPVHLFIGTNAENTADRHRKGRNAFGSRHGTKTKPSSVRRGANNVTHSKLSADDVSVIRALLALGWPQRLIAKRFGVCGERISRINTNKSWFFV